MRITYFLSESSVTEVFTAVDVIVDDYLKACVAQGRFKLPQKPNQKGTYSELFSIVMVGEILQQKNQGLWYTMVKTEYKALFPELPELSRCYRIQRNFERIHADFGLRLAQHDGVYLIDSKPIPIGKGSRDRRERLMTEAVSGRGGATKFFYGFKLHAITNLRSYACRFGIVAANEHDA